MSFVEHHGLWSDEQHQAAKRLTELVKAEGLEVVRLSFPDQHGILRGKTLIAQEAIATLRSGCTITTTVLAKDTSHRTVFPVFTPGGGFGMREMEGGADVLMVADPTTFRLLPWAANTGWVLCDLYFSNGKPVPFATRGLYRNVLGDLAQRGYPGSRSNSISSSSTTPRWIRPMRVSRESRRPSACSRRAISI